MSEIDEKLNRFYDVFDSILESAKTLYEPTTSLKTITLLEKERFLRLYADAFYSAFELCISKILDLLVQKLNEEISDGETPEDFQAQVFDIVSYAFIINNGVVLYAYVPKIDWTDWHPLDAEDVEYTEIYEQLIKRFPDLARFPKPSH